MKNWVDEITVDKDWIYNKVEIWELTKLWVMQNIEKTSGGQNLERPNVQWSVFRNFKIARSK